MPIGLYMDVHVPKASTDSLRLRGIDVLTVIAGAGTAEDLRNQVFYLPF